MKLSLQFYCISCESMNYSNNVNLYSCWMNLVRFAGEWYKSKNLRLSACYIPVSTLLSPFFNFWKLSVDVNSCSESSTNKTIAVSYSTIVFHYLRLQFYITSMHYTNEKMLQICPTPVPNNNSTWLQLQNCFFTGHKINYRLLRIIWGVEIDICKKNLYLISFILGLKKWRNCLGFRSTTSKAKEQFCLLSNANTVNVWPTL